MSPITMLAEQEGMQNVYAPLPFTAHLIFCVLATLLYAVLFNRRGKRHYLIMMIAIDLTLMTQFWAQEVVVFFIGFAEIIMLIMALVLSLQSAKEDRERERRLRIREERERYEEEQEELKDRQYKIHMYDGEDETIIDSAFDDEDE